MMIGVIYGSSGFGVHILQCIMMMVVLSLI